jgi:membrane associated rhomboid family serine protease
MKRLQYNSPVVLTFALISLLSLGLGYLTKDISTRLLFSTYRSSLLNPLTYLRAFGHVLGHANWSHYSGNMIYILLLGPMLEEKYGSQNLIEMICITAVVTAIANAIFFPNVMLLGASGIVYMMIILSSQAGLKEGRIPLTLILACVVYIGGEITSGLFTQDNIAHFAHVIGGVCGGAFGFVLVKSPKE